MKLQKTENILGYQVVNSGYAACLKSISDWVKYGNKCRWLATINPHSFVVAKHNGEFSEALHSADWLVPDGTGIVIASRWRKGAITERVTGSDVFLGVHDCLNQLTECSVFFLGSTQKTLDDIKIRMHRDYPNIRVAGSYSPPFKEIFTDEDNAHIISAINNSKPDVLWVGMTAPKQEVWLHRHKDQLDVKFAAAIGAVFDFYAGRIRRAHPLMQRIGLEWLSRFLREPQRLWRRMFVSAPVFLWDVIRHPPHRKNR